MHTVTLNVPEDLYSRISEQAQRSQRSVEAELISVLSTAVTGVYDLPPDLADAVAGLDCLNDADLWQAARGRLPDRVSAELESLHAKSQRNGLTEAESQRSDELSLEYDRSMLVRARAAALLKERGHDVTSLLGRP
jgi:plasmid stability protein